jgi:hypothetical protein
MVIIKHLTGPRAGTEDRFDSKSDRIVFGRRVSCDVIFPPDETIVAREHFALVRKPPGPAGHWIIETFGEPFVAVNGIAAEPGQRLPADAIIELGKHGGPSFSAHVEADTSTENLAVTGPQEQDGGAGIAAAKAGKLARFARRIAFGGLSAAIIAGAVTVYFHAIEPKLGIGSAVRAHLMSATFLVEAPIGVPEATAFPIGPNTLATNAHVGDLFKKLLPGQQMIVRSPGKEGKTYEVTNATLHPGYDRFEAFLSQDVLRRNIASIGVPGYDVATLTVKEQLPPETILQLAGTDELKALNPGIELATAGYPMEGIVGGNAQAYGAAPEYHTGAITALTDFFFLPADFAYSQLIHHSLPSAGGASGSPIVNEDGHVVALLSAGNSYQPGSDEARVPSGVLINYGQRVDLLQQLLAGETTSALAEDEEYWTRQFAVFKSGIDIIDNVVASKIQDGDDDHRISLTKVAETTDSLTHAQQITSSKEGTQRQAILLVTSTADTEYVFIAYAHDESALQLFVDDGGKSLVHAGTPTDFPDSTFFPWVRYKAPSDSNLSVRVVSPGDQDVTYTLQVLTLQIQ